MGEKLIHDGRVLLAAGIATAVPLWGGVGALVQLLLVLMALDIVTGMLAAFVTRELSSTASFRGMAKKSLILVLVAAAGAVQPITGLTMLVDAVAGFYAANEMLSILENAARAGLPIPAALTDALAKVKAATSGKPAAGGQA